MGGRGVSGWSANIAGLITGKRFLFYEKRTEQMLHQVRTFSLGLLQIDPDNADKQSRLTPEVI